MEHEVCEALTSSHQLPQKRVLQRRLLGLLTSEQWHQPSFRASTAEGLTSDSASERFLLISVVTDLTPYWHFLEGPG